MIPENMKHDWSALIDGLARSRYAVAANALPTALVDALAAEFTQNLAAGRFRSAGIGRGLATGVDPAIRGDSLCWLEPDMPAAAAYLACMEGLRAALNRELFLGIREFEAHYAHYAPGSFYRRHVDRHQDSNARVVSTVLYLNPDWPVDGGGELHLFDSADRHLLTLPPRGNTLVVFMSDDMPHEVAEARCERRSIPGWFRR
jgi:SM-20-related protein